MRMLPFDYGVIHFVGIGGIGMSGIAEVMHNLGYQVRGSDQADSVNVQRLRNSGIEVAIGHREDNVLDAKAVVVSSAIKVDNPEFAAARDGRIPIVPRAEMLGELMRLKWSVAVGGTHGKTTTTSLIAAIFDAADLDPTVINGGIINAYGTNARRGDGEWMVVEADESDGSFLKLPATMAVVTNIDPEHMDFYSDFDAIRQAFQDFVENLPFYGSAILCIDHAEVQSLIGQITDRRLVTYGFSPQADVQALDVQFGPDGAQFSISMSERMRGGARQIDDYRLPMLGQHNVSNALAAIAIAEEIGIAQPVVRRALAGFSGVHRRFSRVGEVNGIAIIDDYGHHPVEIAAVLAAARQMGRGQIIAVVQPHRFSRLQDLFEGFCSCFNDADKVLVADVYAAGEVAIEGVDRDWLVQGLRDHGHKDAAALAAPSALAQAIVERASAGDVVVCLGAGTITQWAHQLPQQIAELTGEQGGGA